MTTTTTTPRSKKPPRTRPPRKAPPKPKATNVELTFGADECNAIKAVAIAASTDLARPPLPAIHMVGDGETLTLTATDSYRLHRAVVPCMSPGFSALVPAAWLVKTLRELRPRRRTAPPELATVTLTLRDGTATVVGVDETRSVSLVAAGYPDVDVLLADAEALAHSPDTVIAVNPKYYADVLKACTVFGGETSAARFQVAEKKHAPLRFEVEHNGTFIGLLMALRITGE